MKTKSIGIEVNKPKWERLLFIIPLAPKKI